MPSIAGRSNDQADDEIDRKETARGKSTVISGLVKLVLTPCIGALYCHLFSVASLKDLNKGFDNFTDHHPAFPHFMTQISTSLLGSILGKI